MSKKYGKALFIFRRDLRCFDNNGLNAALLQADEVIPCFFLDPRQIEDHPYRSKPALAFMAESLADLHGQLAALGGKLHVFAAEPEAAVAALQAETGCNAVFVNRDYTPFSRRRDEALQQVCLRNGMAFASCHDLLLNEPETVLTGDGTPYRVFTAFYRRSCERAVAVPEGLPAGRLGKIDGLGGRELPAGLSRAGSSALPGGRQGALQLLGGLPHYREYGSRRDFPALAATSNLSVYLKFGCCSVREAYHAAVRACGPDHALLRQLYWRDFFSHIGWHFPHVFGHAFHRQYDNIAWRNDENEFQRWADGTTGFPIVDAGMRQLRETGMMHNRARMIAASFLVKDLHISWRWGERHFARHLLDYDPCLNNGNWQWAASTGCDAQPYFRIFNPWLQQQKFDPDCDYIKRWVAELRGFTPAAIHAWLRKPQAGGYPPPMVDHALRSRQAKMLFQEAKQTASAGSVAC